MTLLVVAPPGTTASSINPRRATPILPIAIGRPNSPPPRSLPKQALIAHRQQTASEEIPIASDARPLHTSRGFLPWRFADAGPPVSAAPPSWGRHPQTFTKADMRWVGLHVGFVPFVVSLIASLNTILNMRLELNGFQMSATFPIILHHINQSSFLERSLDRIGLKNIAWTPCSSRRS